MGYTEKGVLIFGEWFEAMDKLNPKDYKALMNSIYRYQMKGEEPPEFKGKAGMVALIIFPYIGRRLAQSKGGKRSAEMRGGQFCGNPIIDEILKKRDAKLLEDDFASKE